MDREKQKCSNFGRAGLENKSFICTAYFSVIVPIVECELQIALHPRQEGTEQNGGKRQNHSHGLSDISIPWTT